MNVSTHRISTTSEASHDVIRSLWGFKRESDNKQLAQQDVYEKAIQQGFSPALHPGACLSALARWSANKGHQQEVKRWWERLGKDGALAADVKNQGALVEHPIALGIFFANWVFAKLALEKGVCTDWVCTHSDSENPKAAGVTLWHLLAFHKSVKATQHVFIEALAQKPDALNVVNTPMNTNWQNAYTGDTPLHVACTNQNGPVIKALLKVGANPNAQNAQGKTPLHHLTKQWGDKVSEGTVYWLRFLLDAGADTTLTDKNGQTALQEMIGRSSIEAITVLIDHHPEIHYGVKVQRALRRYGEPGKALAERLALRESLSESKVENSEELDDQPIERQVKARPSL